MSQPAFKHDSILNCRIRKEVASNQVTTFGVGKGISLLLEPESVEKLLEIIPTLNDQPRFIGNGSNLVLPDYWVTAPIIRLPKSLSGAVPGDSLVGDMLAAFKGEAFYAGSSLINLSRTFSQQGKSGLEFAAGIPGSLGGAVKMNAGAHGESISDVITGVVIVDNSAQAKVLSKNELNFSYRHSLIKEDVLVLAASILLKEGNQEEIRSRRESCLEYRTKTQPLKMPSAGSLFRNPVDPGVPSEEPLRAAAFYLEKVGLKGYRSGGVGYSELHSNWLVRLEDFARAESVVELIELGRKRVFEAYGLNLTPEILVW